MERDCIVILLFDLSSVLGYLLHYSAAGRFSEGNSVFPLVPHFGIVSLIDSIVRIGAFRISNRSLHKCEALLFPFYSFKFILRVIYKQ